MRISRAHCSRCIRLLLTCAVAVACVSGVSAAPEVTNLSISKFPGGQAGLRWDAQSSAVFYRLYMGRYSELPNFCFDSRTTLEELNVTDSATVASGDAILYLISAVDAGGESPLGLIDGVTPRETTLDCDTDLYGVRDSQDNCPIDANPAQNDGACEFEASGVTLRSRVTLDAFPRDPGLSHRANEMGSYVAPSGEEYAVLGLRNGVAFYRVTDPANPQLVGYVDGDGINMPWRDMAVFGSYAYIVSDGEGIGLQIADLSQIDLNRVTLANTRSPARRDCT